MAPLQIDFSNTSDDEARHCIPVYLRVKPSQDEEMSIKIIDDTTVETNHGMLFERTSRSHLLHVGLVGYSPRRDCGMRSQDSCANDSNSIESLAIAVSTFCIRHSFTSHQTWAANWSNPWAANPCMPPTTERLPEDSLVSSPSFSSALRTNKKATYTRVFPGSVTQQEVFEGTSAPLIRRFLNGANVMTFAYGVTSSGKTYTIMGSQADPGILPRTLELIFGSCKSKIDDTIPIYKPTKFDEVEEIADEDIDLLEDLKATLISKVCD